MTYRMEVEVAGEFIPVRGVKADMAWMDEVPMPLDHRRPVSTTFSATFEVQGEAFGQSLRDLIARAEREARQERARRRLWLRYPYPGASR